MARYINADKLRNEIKDLPEQERIELMGIYDVIRNQPPADVQEVKHGKFVGRSEPFDYIVRKCNRCTLYTPVGNFCMNCGAKMDGKDNPEMLKGESNESER